MKIWPLTWRETAGAFTTGEDVAAADCVLYFAQRDIFERPDVFQSLRDLCPSAKIAGCSTGTTIIGGDVNDAIPSAIAIRLDQSQIRMVSTPLSVADSREAGRRLGEGLGLDALAGVLVLSDGLKVNGAALVEGLQEVLGVHVPIGGGLAGDGAAFERTLVAADSPPEAGIAIALGFYGANIRIDTGAAHGWDYFGPVRRITKSDGVVLRELDGKSALTLYEKYLGEEAAGLPASALLYPLLITNPDNPQDQVVRTVLGIDRDAGTLTFAGDIPQGWTARLMRGAFDHLTQGAGDAARLALKDGQAESGLALLVSCVGRRLLMGQRTASEVEAVLEALPKGFSQIGFYSYGEIASVNGANFCGLHNQTMTVMTFREAA